MPNKNMKYNVQRTSSDLARATHDVYGAPGKPISLHVIRLHEGFSVNLYIKNSCYSSRLG